MSDAISKMQKSAQVHRDENPGHVVEEHDRTIPDLGGITEAWWHCNTCADNARCKQTTGWAWGDDVD